VTLKLFFKANFLNLMTSNENPNVVELNESMKLNIEKTTELEKKLQKWNDDYSFLEKLFYLTQIHKFGDFSTSLDPTCQTCHHPK